MNALELIILLLMGANPMENHVINEDMTSI